MKKIFTTNKLLLLCISILLLIFILTLFANFIAPYDADQQNITNRLALPSWQHLLGTDQLGRDIFSRVLFGGRATLILSVCIVIFVLTVSIIIGGLSGYFGGIFDKLIIRLCDLILSFPNELISLSIVAILGPSLFSVTFSLVVVRWPWYVKMIRTEVKNYKSKNYVAYSISSGKNQLWVFKKHILPFLVPSFWIYSTLDVSAVILSVSTFSFLGVGVQPPTAEWGRMLSESKEVAVLQPWQMIPAGCIIFTVVAMINYIGDYLAERFQLEQAIRY